MPIFSNQRFCKLGHKLLGEDWIIYCPNCFLLDARDVSEYAEAHILLAKGVKTDDKGERKIPFGVHLPSLLHCVVYDGNTVSIVEDSECHSLGY